MNSVFQSPVANVFESEVFVHLGLTLIHSLWQLALLGLLFKVFLTIVNRRASRTRYWGAMLFLFTSIALPAITFFTLPNSSVRTEPELARVATVDESELPIGDSSPSITSQTELTGAVPQLQLPTENNEVVVSETNYLGAGLDKGSGSGQVTFARFAKINSMIVSCSPYITLVWFLGVLLFSFRPMGSVVGIIRLKTTGLTDLGPTFSNRSN